MNLDAGGEKKEKLDLWWEIVGQLRVQWWAEEARGWGASLAAVSMVLA
jgi:hypothetical protein